jgi:acyl-CoA thioesterase II
MDRLGELIELLRLERLEEDLFRGESQDPGWGRIFGGQVLGQALSAASQTVPAERPVHSLHAYFLRPGDIHRPIVYSVDRIRDGRSFTTRNVQAIQGGRAILSLSASFQVNELGYEHADPMPDAPPPESLKATWELGAEIADQFPEPVRALATAVRPIEIRPVDPQNPLKPTSRPPQRLAWFRATGPVPDEDATHRFLLAYASDFHFLTTSLQPHGRSWLRGGVQLASIDHAMWFHQPFRVDEWLLYAVESPAASGARGIVRGRFFTRDGRLVATTAQEGLIRDRAFQESAGS